MTPDLDPASRAGDAYLAHLDLDVMEQLLSLDDGGTGLLEEMLGLYKEDTPGRIQALAAALADGDLTGLGDVAHAVKGSAGTMGAPKVRAVAALLEAAGRLGKSDVPPADLLAQLRQAYADSLEALDRFVASKQTGA